MALLNRVRFATTTTGTGAITVGAASTGFQTPASAGAVNGGTYPLVIEDGAEWELSNAVYTAAGTTLSRTLVQSSTGSLLNLSGSAVAYISPFVSDLAATDLDRATLYGRPVISGTTGGVLTTDANGDVTVSTTVTLTNDAFVRNLTLTAAGVINTNGFRIFGTGNFGADVAASNAFRVTANNGSNSTNQTGGTAGAALSGTTVGGSVAGTTGATATTTVGATAATVGTNSGQVGGGAGSVAAAGSGASGAGGGATGVAAGIAASARSYPFRIVQELLRGVSLLVGGHGGRGGSSGGNDGTAVSGGGGGGGGGGVIAIYFRTISLGSNPNPGIIRALGGNGGNGNAATAGNRGGGSGGSGGGGGLIYIVTENVTGGAGLQWAWADGGVGGNGGAGFGTGTAGGGSGGGDGGAIIMINSLTGALTQIIGAAGSAGSGVTGGAGGQCRLSN